MFTSFKKSTPPVLSESSVVRLQAWQSLEETNLTLPHYQTRYAVLDVIMSDSDPEKGQVIQLAAFGVSQGRIRPRDTFFISPQSEGDWLDFLEFVGCAPVVSYRLSFLLESIAPALQQLLGIVFKPVSLDLSVLLPEIFRDSLPNEARLDEWLAYFSVTAGRPDDPVANALSKSRLLQRLLAEAQRRGVVSPRNLLDLSKARRWLRGDA